MPTPVVASVHVGRGVELAGEEPVRTGFRKHAVAGRVRVLREGLVGDEQVHTAVHGGAERAVLAYPAEHYAAWKGDGIDLAFGAFGENLVLSGLDERSACIGDVYRVGSVLLEVSVPRTPCRMITRASGIADLSDRVHESGRTGWLHRVLEEGELRQGDAVLAYARPNPTWTVARAASVMERMRALDPTVVKDARELAAVDALAARWRQKLRERADAVAGA